MRIEGLNLVSSHVTHLINFHCGANNYWNENWLIANTNTKTLILSNLKGEPNSLIFMGIWKERKWLLVTIFAQHLKCQLYYVKVNGFILGFFVLVKDITLLLLGNFVDLSFIHTIYSNTSPKNLIKLWYQHNHLIFIIRCNLYFITGRDNSQFLYMIQSSFFLRACMFVFRD